jgi:hypothetical protein
MHWCESVASAVGWREARVWSGEAEAEGGDEKWRGKEGVKRRGEGRGKGRGRKARKR